MFPRGPIAQPGSELPAHNRLVPGSNPGGPIPFVPAHLSGGRFYNAGNETLKRTLRDAHNISGGTTCVKR
jgi:hypothetical protein